MTTHGRPEGPRYIRFPLVILFVAVISLPLAVNIAGIDGADPSAENRELATFPKLDGSAASLTGFGDGLSDWFGDHFGFRSTLVRWYGESRLFGLGVSPATLHRLRLGRSTSGNSCSCRTTSPSSRVRASFGRTTTRRRIR